jgi:integrase
MRASDFNLEAGTITVRESKAGKPRHVALTDEGRALFVELTAGKTGRGPIFVRDDGKIWGASHQQRPLDAASARAKLDPPATFHILRHTYASALAMRGVPMGVIAAQLGHSDTRMTERHYAHFAPSYVADTVRAALPDLGIVEASNIVSFANSGKHPASIATGNGCA